MTIIWVIVLIVNLFIIRIFYLGLREMHGKGKSIVFEIILLAFMYGAGLYLLIDYLINGSAY